MGTPVLAFHILQLFGTLTWAAWLLLALWAWQKTKGSGYLFQMVGAAGLTLFAFLGMIGTGVDWEAHMWLSWIFTAVMAVGFYFLVAPLVSGQLASLKGKMQAPQSPPPGGSPK